MQIALVAGEASGDQLGAGLIIKIRESFPEALFYGIGGPLMKRAGFTAIYDIEDISMIGLDGVFSNLPRIIRIRRDLLVRFLKKKPDVFIGIDVPDFNIGLEIKLTRHLITCIHYVSPTIWAWRSYRIHKIKKAIAHMLVLFPFETKIYKKHQIPVTFVGHPLANEVDAVPVQSVCRKIHGIACDVTVIALLPGSRRSEIIRHSEVFLQSAVSISKKEPGIHFIISAVNTDAQSYINDLLLEKFSKLNVKLITGSIKEVISASDIVLAASGTVTLETALLGKPMVMAYKVSKISELMVKYFSHVDKYAMPNYLLDIPDVPEFVQQKASPENLSTALLNYVYNPQLQRNIIYKFNKMKAKLKADDKGAAAAVICSYLNNIK